MYAYSAKWTVNKMGYCEIFQMTPDGAGWTNLDDLSIGDKVELELALMTEPKVQLLCVVCLVPVPSGMGHSYCETHKPKKWRRVAVTKCQTPVLSLEHRRKEVVKMTNSTYEVNKWYYTNDNGFICCDEYQYEIRCKDCGESIGCVFCEGDYSAPCTYCAEEL
jgi:hypothetical protein